MKKIVSVLGLLAFSGCDTIGFGTSVSVGSDGTSVSNTVSGTSGNVTGGVRMGR